MTLPNPERAWMPAPAMLTDRGEVECRIGPTAGPVELLGGGLINRNIRIGHDRVLRIFRKPALVGKEAAIASRDWRSFRVPKVLARGTDYLLFEYVQHSPLSAAHGKEVGRALAEIHSVTYDAIGFLGDDLTVVQPFPDNDFSPRGYGMSQLPSVEQFLGAELSARIASYLETNPLAARNAVDRPVLSHSDFKLGNVHWTEIGKPLVLDWEFAWAGSRYVDIGQIMRWHPPETFVQDFAGAYVANGGVLFNDWRRFAETVDLCSLLGLYRNPEARMTEDVLRRIVDTIER